MTQLRQPFNNPAYVALRERQKDKFEKILFQSLQIDFSNCNLRGFDFSELSLTKVIFQGSYLHSADLRGVDLSHHNLEGCSFHRAKISGVLFPQNVSADEIRLSVEYGTRIRVK